MANQNHPNIPIFNEWNEEKKKLDISQQRKIIFHERQVWWCSLGKNIGDEQDGKNELFERPILIIKKFNQGIAWVVPLSSRVKQGKHYHIFTLDGKLQRAMLSQLRLISSKRFQRIKGEISKSDFRTIRTRIIQLF